MNPVDQLAEALHGRVLGLLAARPDVSKADFGRAIRRGPSWLSEFFSKQRTTNDLRLVARMARFFGVSIGYLLGESDGRAEDAEVLSLLAAWRGLRTQKDRRAVLQLAVHLSVRDEEEPTEPAAPVGAPERPTARGGAGTEKPQKRTTRSER
jgi:hypothetical protein